jgi:hypothetical protein
VDDTIISGQKKAQAGRRGQDSNRELWKIWAAINRDIEDNLKEVTFDKLISHINSDQLTYNI